MHPESECDGKCNLGEESPRAPLRVGETTFCGYTVDQIQDFERAIALADARRIAAETEAEHRRVELVTIHPALREAAELAFRKSQDYGDPDWSRRSYFPFGHESYLQMLHTKMERLKFVASKGSANFESARDSALDLINYASFYVAWMDEQKRASEPTDLGPLVIERDAEGQPLTITSPSGLSVPIGLGIKYEVKRADDAAAHERVLAPDGMLAPDYGPIKPEDPNLQPLAPADPEPDVRVKLDTQPAKLNPAKLKLPPKVQAQVGEALADTYLADPVGFATKDPGLAAFAQAIRDAAFNDAADFNDAAEVQNEANAQKARLRDALIDIRDKATETAEVDHG